MSLYLHPSSWPLATGPERRSHNPSTPHHLYPQHLLLETPSLLDSGRGVVPLPFMRMEPQPPVMATGASSLRRRISDSSTSSRGCESSLGSSDSFDEKDGELEAADLVEERRGLLRYQPCLHNPAKRRRRCFRVGFRPQLVEKVHPYPPEDHDDEPGVPPSPVAVTTSLWYTHSELLAMKRVAKRTCARNHDLEHALNDAYHHHHCLHGSSDSPTQSQPSAEPAELTDDSKQEMKAAAKLFDPASLPPSSYPSLLEEEGSASVSSTPDEPVDDAATSDDDDVQKRLLSIPSFQELRGMERWSSQRHALSRGLTMLQVKTEVFVRQAQHATTQSPMSASSDVRGPSGPEIFDPAQASQPTSTQQQSQGRALELARACSEASFPAARFARLMGRLDEAVARELHAATAKDRSVPDLMS